MQTLNVSKINRYLTNIKKGTLSSLTKLFKYTYSNLYCVAFAYVRNKNDIEDVLSKAYENAVRYIHTFDKTMNGYNWLYTIVKNCAKEFNKKDFQRLCVVCDIDEEREDEFEILDHIVLKVAINSLSDQDKKLLYQIYWEGWTVKEIARVSGVPITTIYSRLGSIYKKLREFYKE